MTEGPQPPETPARPVRDETAYRECTRNPLFLFQRKRYHLTGDPEDRGLIFSEDDWTTEDDPEHALSWAELEELELAKHYWETEHVWLTREEANAYGEQRSYNYPDGWQVFCVPANGSLRALVDPTEPVR